MFYCQEQRALIVVYDRLGTLSKFSLQNFPIDDHSLYVSLKSCQQKIQWEKTSVEGKRVKYFCESSNVFGFPHPNFAKENLMGKDLSEEKEFNWHISLITFTLSHKYIELQLSLVKKIFKSTHANVAHYLLKCCMVTI